MISTTSLTALAIAGALLLGQDPARDTAAAKAKLASAMKATQLSFEASSSGLSFLVSFTDSEKREQKVFVTQAPAVVDGMVVHTIYTTVWIDAQKPPDEALMRKVFTISKKLGSFWLFKDQKGVWAIRFGTQFDATALPAESKSGEALVKVLEDTIRFVQQVGAETDKELNGAVDVK